MGKGCLLKKPLSVIINVQIHFDLMKLHQYFYISLIWNKDLGSQNVERSQNHSGYVTKYTTFLSRSNRLQMFFKIGAKVCNVIKKRLQHSYFPVNTAKFLGTVFL